MATEAPTQPRFASPESYTPKHLAEKILTSKAALELSTLSTGSSLGGVPERTRLTCFADRRPTS